MGNRVTLYALTTDGVTVTTTATMPPTGARRLDTGAWVTPPADGWTDALAAACGWLPVVESPRPADTATDTHEPTYTRDGATVVQTWTPRPWTANELAAQATDSTRRTLDQKVRDAVVKGGTLDVSLGTPADVAPALTNAAIKVASLRSLNKLSNADTAANAGPIIQRLIALMIDGAQIDKRTGKLAVQLFDES